MRESSRIIDARGLACPQPVVLAKKAIEEGTPGDIEVVVDNETARENVARFAEYSGRKAEVQQNEDGTTRIVIRSPDASAPTVPGADGQRAELVRGYSAAREAAPPEKPETSTVFLASDRIGQGDDVLGALLMKGFIYALAEGEHRPDRVILMNGGVKLAAEGSESMTNLGRLAAAGAEILACGTCLDFYGLKEKLAIGRVSNMYEIVAILSSSRVLRP
jgi:selenium metabolism protein YedF